MIIFLFFFFFFQAEDGIRDFHVTGVQTCALPISRRLPLLPDPDPAALRELATVVLPAVGVHGLLGALRSLVSATARPALDAALDALGLLTAPDTVGGRAVVVPTGLVQDPGGWLRHATDAWRTNAAASAVALLDALAPLVVPGRGTAPGWPLAGGVTLGYTVVAGNRLRLVLDAALSADLGGQTVTAHLAGGLVIGPDGLPQPTLEVSGLAGGAGVQLAVDRSEEHTSELQSRENLVCRLLLE